MKKTLTINDNQTMQVSDYMDILHYLNDYCDDERVDSITYTLNNDAHEMTLANIVHAHYLMRARNLHMRQYIIGIPATKDLIVLRDKYLLECRYRHIDTMPQVLHELNYKNDDMIF